MRALPQIKVTYALPAVLVVRMREARKRGIVWAQKIRRCAERVCDEVGV